MENIIQIIKEEFEKINSRMDDIENKIDNLEDKFDNFEDELNTLSKNNLNKVLSSNFEKTKFDDYNIFCKIGKNFVDVDTELDIFKIIYKNNDIPIKVEGVRKFYYRYNNEWIPDTNAYHISNQLFSMFEDILMKINTLDRVNSNYDAFLSNQEHIFKLRNKQYRKSVIRKIQEFI